LGVRRIMEFNLSLLDKWCWRLKEERWSLWCRVLAAGMVRKEAILRMAGKLVQSSGRP